MGSYFGICMVFSVYAKVHIFIARKSAANLDFNRCNDTSVPYNQQRYNPNIIRGIIHDFNMIFLMIMFLGFVNLIRQMSKHATEMDLNGFLTIAVLILQLVNFIFFTHRVKFLKTFEFGAQRGEGYRGESASLCFQFQTQF